MNPQDVRTHPLNNSQSKYAFKFGRSSRFREPRLYTHSIYTIEEKGIKKGCGFGYGQRSSPEGHSKCAPCPTNYDLPSTLGKKARSFGSSRDDTKFQSFLLKALKDASNPSPNSYHLPSSLKERRFSIRERLPTQIDLKTKNYVPSPAAYRVDGSHSLESGKFSSSKNKNIRRIIIFGRDSTEVKSFPVGPGSYNIGRDYSPREDRFRATCKTFGSATRPGPEDKSKKWVPGPGEYDNFSQFPQVNP